jgi:peptide/nickel transport system substrate-binding protein
MNDDGGYWSETRQRRLTRRHLLVAGGTGAAMVSLMAAGCGGQKGSQSGSERGASASGTQAAETPQSGGVYNYYQIGNPPTLDSYRTTSNLTHRLSGAVYNRLFRFKAAHDPSVTESKEVENDLALASESPDALTWTIKLRPDARFHNIAPVNGHSVEAEDIKASFVRALDPKNPNGGSLDMVDANQIQTPSKDTVILKLKYPYAAFPAIIAVQNGWVFPREVLTGSYDPAKQMIGSGPFVFDSYTPDVAVTFKRNPDWVDKGQPYVDGVRMAVIPDTAQQLAQFRAGNLDQIEIVANDLDAVRRDNPKADLLTGSPSTMNPLVGLLRDPTSPWTDPRVRRAFSMAMDRAALGASAIGAKYQPQALLPLSLGRWVVKPVDLDPALGQVYKYDPTMAKQLLAAAGASNLTLKLVYTPNGYAQPYGNLAEGIGNMLNNIGIKTTLVQVDYNSEYVGGGKGYRSGNFSKDTVVLTTMSGGYTIIDEILFRFYDSKSEARFSQINDSTLDSMIDKARATLDEGGRLKAYQDVQKYLIDKTYYVTGWPWQPAYTMLQPWVHNYNHSTSYGSIAESYAKLWLKKP